MSDEKFPDAECPECGAGMEYWVEEGTRKVMRYTKVGYGDYFPEITEPIRGRVVVGIGSRETVQNDSGSSQYLKCVRNCGFRKDLERRHVVLHQDDYPRFASTPIPVQEPLFHGEGEQGGWDAPSDIRG